MILLFDFDIFLDYNKKTGFIKEIVKLGLPNCFILSEEFDETSKNIIGIDDSLIIIKENTKSKDDFICKFLNKYKQETIIFFTNNKNFLLQLEYNQNLYIKNFFSKHIYNYKILRECNKIDAIKQYINEMQNKSFITLEKTLIDEEINICNSEIKTISKYIQNIFFKCFTEIKTDNNTLETLKERHYLNTEKYNFSNENNRLLEQKEKVFYMSVDKQNNIYILDEFEYFKISKIHDTELLKFIKSNTFVVFDKEKIFKLLNFALPNYQDLKMYYWLIDNTKKNIEIDFMLEKLLNIDLRIGSDKDIETKKLISIKVLYEHIKKMKSPNLKYFKMEKEFEEILDLMNSNVYSFDSSEWQEDKNIIELEINKTIQKLKEKELFLQNTDFNNFLSDENIVYFFKKINIKIKLKNNKIVLNNEEIEKYQDLLNANYLDDFLIFKKARILKYFIQAVKAIKPIDNQIKTTLSSINTKTGRLTSREVNLQNISRESILENRNLFVSKYIKTENKSDFVKIDYSQIELRMLAHFSQDSFLIKSFQSGEDIHLNTALELFKNELNEHNIEQYRKIAKAINFGLVYGMGARALSETIKQPLEIAKNYIENHKSILRGATSFIEELQKEAKKNKYIYSLNGRKIYFEEGILSNKLDRVSINNLCQASASDVIKLAMIIIKRELGVVPLLQIHDELIFDCKATEKIDKITDIMKNIYSDKFIQNHQDLYFNKELKINLDVNVKIDKSI